MTRVILSVFGGPQYEGPLARDTTLSFEGLISLEAKMQGMTPPLGGEMHFF